MSDFDRDFIARQIHHLGGSGLSAEKARSRIEAQLGPEAAAQFDGALAGLGAEDGPLIRRLLDFGQAKGLDQSQLSASLLELRDGLRARLQPELNRFGGFYSYVTIVSIFVLIILALFSVSIIPQFNFLFASFDADLPALTRLLIEPWVQAALVGVLLVLVLGLLTVSRAANRVFALRRDSGRWIHRLPPVAGVMRRFDLWLHVLTFELLLKSGAAAETLESELHPLVRGDKRRSRAEQESVQAVLARLSAAQRLGTATQELAYWDSRCESEFNQALDRTRSALGVAVQVTLGAIVGFLVVGMYLPLFKLAQVV